MKAVFAIVLVAGAFWVWQHHTASDSTFCVTAPQQVCVEHVSTTTRPH